MNECPVRCSSDINYLKESNFILNLSKNFRPDLDVPMFFGFVGLFIMLMLWPGLVVMHLTGWELFELPNQHQFLFLGLNGLVGTVLCELIWLWACFLTSPLQATLALSFINPGSILVNYVSLLSKNCLTSHFFE